ncbi:MAG: hypothetical protein QM778_37595 [Myxococcales bacterium]
MNPRWWGLLFAWLVACAGTCGGGEVAELDTLSGDVKRDLAARQGSWLVAASGDRLSMGDGLRTGDKSVARLRLFPEGSAVVEPNTVMRFLAQAPGNANERITLEEGAVELTSLGLDLEVHTARGLARLSKGARVRVNAGEGATSDVTFDVLVGKVTVQQEDGSTVNLSQGQELSLKQPEVAATSPKPASEVAAETNDSESGVSTSSRADFGLLGPESATVHATTLPVDVRVGLESCADGPMVLDVSGPAGRNQLTPARGSDSVVVRLTAGSYRLKMRCGKKPVGNEGTLRVQRDPATMELPKTVPHVEVEADGRRYTVRYQNVLPVVAMGWSEAPAAARYNLVIRKGGREQRYDLKRPQHELKSGELGEGEYEFAFTASDGHHSAQGSLRIVFDNTARSAYLSAPAEGSPNPGNEIPVAGTALLRSDVSVDGVPVALDAQGRFRATVPVSPTKGALAVRVSHPVTGVHYYLRRLR